MATGERFRIQFERSGGLAGFSVQTTLDSARLSEAEVAELRGLIERVDFAVPPNQPRGADRFQYDLKMRRGGRSQSIRAFEGSMSPELRALIDWLLAHARRGKA